MTRSSVFLLIALTTSLVGQDRIPPPHESFDCSTVEVHKELPHARFERNGGRTSRAKVVVRDGILTVENVAEGRNLKNYEQLVLVSPTPRTAVGMASDPVLRQARAFLWEHWRDKKRGYLTLTLSSVDATSTSHIFVEQDPSNRWRVSWRIVRHDGDVNDLPTYYSVEWVHPLGFERPGTPLRKGELPDPAKDTLQFRGNCADADQSL